MGQDYKNILVTNLTPALVSCVMTHVLLHGNLATDMIIAAVPGLANIFADAFERRKASRFFEDIAAEVSKSLVPVFEREGQMLDDGGKSSVANLIAETFNSEKVDVEGIISNRFNPARLSAVLIDAAQSRLDQLSEAEQSFFRRIVFECCNVIVKTATQLPAFTESSIKAILDGEAAILATVRNLTARIDSERSESIQKQQSDVERFEQSYYKALENLDKVELFGLKCLPESHSYNLTVAYVTLTVEPKKTNAEHRNDEYLAGSYRGYSVVDLVEAQDTKQRKAKMRLDSQATSSRVSVEHLLAQSNKLLILGIAGSGKTTLLQWIAVRSGKGDFDGRLQKLNGTVPFFIRLRKWIKLRYPRPGFEPPSIDEFIDEVKAYTGEAPKGWVRDKLASGKSIILIDGIDEVDKLGRSKLQQWINHLVKEYPRCRFVVTGRTHIQDDWLEGAKFMPAEIQSMRRSDIDFFIDRWHEAARSEARTQTEIKQLYDYSASLKRTLKRNSEIRRLATNPLLCSMLCALHRFGQKQLPDNRIALYRECIDVLIHKRDEGADVNVPDLLALTLTQKQAFLKILAHEFVRRDLTEASTQNVLNWIEKIIPQVNGLGEDITSDEVLDTLIHRSGIIREFTHGSVDFIHKTFQEFLAAEELLDKNDVNFFIRNVIDERWAEVLALVVGMASASIRNVYLKRLVQEAEEANQLEMRKAFASLAAACLPLTPIIDPQLQEKILSLFEECIPPITRTEAKSVARVGRPAISLLKNCAMKNQSALAMCIVAIANIGGEEAMQALVDLSTQTQPRARAELLRAWDQFDRKDYAREVISNVLGINGNFPVEMPSSLEGISAAEGIKKLIFTTRLYMEEQADFTDLQDVQTLESLIIDCRQGVFDLSILAGISTLSELKLVRFKRISDFESLQSLSRLKVLCLGSCTDMADLNWVSGLRSLRELSLEYSTDCTNIEPLFDLNELEALELRDFKEIRNVDGLSKMTNLSHISLSGCREVRNLDKLLTLPKLKVLKLRGVHPKLDGIKFPERPDVEVSVDDKRLLPLPF